MAGATENGNDLWCSGKGHRFAGNIQFVAAPGGTPLWVSAVEPGSFHDLSAARIYAPSALQKADLDGDGLPTLATSATPERASRGAHPDLTHSDIQSPLHVDNRTHNKLLRGI